MFNFLLPYWTQVYSSDLKNRLGLCNENYQLMPNTITTASKLTCMIFLKTVVLGGIVIPINAGDLNPASRSLQESGEDSVCKLNKSPKM